MNTVKTYDGLLETFKLNFNQPTEINRASSILLLRHYFRSLLEWKKLLGNDSDYIKSIQAQNLFSDLRSGWLTELKSLDEFQDDLLTRGIKTGTVHSIETIFVYLFVYWELYKTSPEISKYNLPNPYEAAIKVVEREKRITSANGQFVINDITFLNLEKYKSFSLPSIENEFLDFIDQEYNFFTNKIPDQVETDELWVRFQAVRDLYK